MPHFAPTNEAFAALDNETLAHLLSDEGRDDLIDILSYHIGKQECFFLLFLQLQNLVDHPADMLWFS